MEAMSYLHSKNVYFGDMKPENLLVFRDYKVKLGDFGVSIKLPDDIKDTTEVNLKGLTEKFCTPYLKKCFYDESPVYKKDLWENDSFSLYRTFLIIFLKFE
jgi:serine/threonine protein kinase